METLNFILLVLPLLIIAQSITAQDVTSKVATAGNQGQGIGKPTQIRRSDTKRRQYINPSYGVQGYRYPQQYAYQYQFQQVQQAPVVQQQAYSIYQSPCYYTCNSRWYTQTGTLCPTGFYPPSRATILTAPVSSCGVNMAGYYGGYYTSGYTGAWGAYQAMRGHRWGRK